ncbi:MAG: CoA-transferase subunit beta [Gammaproteobacteria bacterium]|jgi:glutaconate CoA-transferase subunit B
MSSTATIKELMAVVLSRELEDGDHLQVGVALPVPEVAVRLAHIMHGPNMQLIFLGARMNVHHLESIPLPAFGWDSRSVRWAESYSDRGHRFDHVKAWHKRVFFVGGLQVDKFGNINLIGIGSDSKKLKFRGPASVGTPTLTTHVGRYYIVLNNHSSRVLVPKCDYVSAVGWHEGGADARKKLGIPGGGPKLCVTPLCVMDFTEVEKRMRLVSLHPGVTLDEVKANTGFELEIPDIIPITVVPTEDELTILRSRVDLNGLLRSG